MVLVSTSKSLSIVITGRMPCKFEALIEAALILPIGLTNQT